MSVITTVEMNAISEAFKRAMEHQTHADNAEQEVSKKTPRSPVKSIPDMPASAKVTPLNALIATIRYKASLGNLDLKLPASKQVEALGARDEEELAAAMFYLGYVEYRKVLSSETFYRKK